MQLRLIAEHQTRITELLVDNERMKRVFADTVKSINSRNEQLTAARLAAEKVVREREQALSSLRVDLDEVCAHCPAASHR